MEHRGLLIYPPNQLMDVETPRPDGSLGLLYLASALEQEGIGADVLDASVGTFKQDLNETFYRNVKQENGLTRIGMSFEEIGNYVKEEGYDFVGINSNFTPQTNMALKTAEAISSKSPATRIFVGGVNARAMYSRFLQSGYFEGVCLTEGELIFPRAIKEGVENIPGFAYLDKERIKVNLPNNSCFPKSLDDLCMPAWEKLPFQKYEEIASPHGVDVSGESNKIYAPIMTSRGCKWNCLYCHNSGEIEQVSKLRLHSIERVIGEIDYLESLGVKRLFFEDDSLLHDKRRVLNIFGEVGKKELSIADTNGVNLMNFYLKEGRNWKIDERYIDSLAEAGFKQIVFPVESGSQRILKKYATNKVVFDRMDVVELMRSMTSRNIQAPVNMMIGFPDESEKEISKSIELGKRLRDAGAPYVTFFIPIPFPGSKLYDLAISNDHLEKDFNPDMLNWKRAIMENTLVPPERLEEIRDFANGEVNSEAHLKSRLEQSMGHRWVSN